MSYSDLFNRYEPNRILSTSPTRYTDSYSPSYTTTTSTGGSSYQRCPACKVITSPGTSHRCSAITQPSSATIVSPYTTTTRQVTEPARVISPGYSTTTIRDSRAPLLGPSLVDQTSSVRITPRQDTNPSPTHDLRLAHTYTSGSTTSAITTTTTSAASAHSPNAPKTVIVTTEVVLPDPGSRDLLPQSKVLSVKFQGEDDKVRTYESPNSHRLDSPKAHDSAEKHRLEKELLEKEWEKLQKEREQREKEREQREREREERRERERDERERQRDLERAERDRQRELRWERELEEKMRSWITREQQAHQSHQERTVLAPVSAAPVSTHAPAPHYEQPVAAIQPSVQVRTLETKQQAPTQTTVTEAAKSRSVEIKAPKSVIKGTKAPTNESLAQMIERKDLSILSSFGGVEGLTQGLQCDTERGLTSSQVTNSANKFGKNELPEAEKVTFFGLVKDALGDTMMMLLIAAAIVSIIFGVMKPDEHGNYNFETGWIEGTAILTSVFVVVSVSAVNDYNKAKKFEEMNAQQAKKSVEVIRQGTKRIIDSSEVVVGDLAIVNAGQTLAADGVFIEGQDLKVDESACTGESDIIKKSIEKDPFFLSGTSITEGEGRMVIVAVGVNSFAGKLTMSTRGAPVETPLQVKLAALAELIGKAGLLASLLTFLILVIKQFVGVFYLNDPHASISPGVFLKFMLVSITMVVVAIPEGLPLAVTIALAYSMKSMLKDNCLVRILAACETMGGANAVCSDKTGTLTTNKMTVVQGWIAEDNFVFDGYGVKGGENATELPSSAKTVKLPMNPNIVNLLCTSMALNSGAEERTPDNWVGGNKTEYGLLGLVTRSGYDYKAMRNNVARESRRSYPFSSAKKRSTTIVRENGAFTIHVKGASEMVLADCTQYMTRNGGTAPLTPKFKDYMISVIMQMANQGNRTIAVAYSQEREQSQFPEEEPQPNLTLIGIVGLQDPIRTEVPDAINQCRQAGIVVRMVTGDNMHTAVAIAKKCGLLKDGEIEEGVTAMEGKTFRTMAAEDPIKLLKLIPKLRVLARSSPTDKLVLVSCLMDEGDIVAVTGDGTNDAPALKLADVGFAMKTGTEVATGASDMVLLDDNFASVVKACIWGRTVNDNIRKFLQFQLTVNVAGVLLTLIGATLNEHNEEPLKPVQMLWLNLIMDTLAALALATEKPTLACLDRLPFYRSSPLLSKRMIAFILIHGFFQLSVQLYLLFKGHDVFSVGPCLKDEHELGSTKEGNCRGGIVHGTIIFNVFIWLQLVNELNARKLYGEKNIFSGLGGSPLFVVIWIVCALFQIAAVEFGDRFMHTHHLTWEQWKLCVYIAAMEIPVGFLVNLLPIKPWKPGPGTNNKAGLDAKKKEAIRAAKIGAGMIPQKAVTHLTNVIRGRWKKATKTVGLQTRTLRAIQDKHVLKKKDVSLRVWETRPTSPRSIQRTPSGRVTTIKRV